MNQGFLDPIAIINNLDLDPQMIAADFGCGSGGWAIPLAKKLEDGKVYAVDILEEALNALKSKLRIEKIYNIETVKGNVEKGVRILSETCDLVLMTNLLFEVDKKKEVLKEGKRILRKGGKILITDWKEGVPLGPEKKVSTTEIKKVAEDLGLTVEKEFEAGKFHFGLLLTKP